MQLSFDTDRKCRLYVFSDKQSEPVWIKVRNMNKELTGIFRYKTILDTLSAYGFTIRQTDIQYFTILYNDDVAGAVAYDE